MLTHYYQQLIALDQLPPPHQKSKRPAAQHRAFLIFSTAWSLDSYSRVRPPGMEGVPKMQEHFSANSQHSQLSLTLSTLYVN